ncbi:MAG: sulfatase-like hydrolase/transferase [Lentisphaeria bacterium]|jgi:arylsulfatase A-like enzyme|nr:sulfatase-like hydrolase/transferase [Lentisphaeria bacterium]
MPDHLNVLHIITDSQRFDTIGALGNPIIRTPALDRLVHQGTAFTSAYTPAPICVAARSCMLNGQYMPHTGCYDNSYPTLPPGSRGFVDCLTAAGYRTHAVGKCHFTPDMQALNGFQTRDRQEETVPHPEEDDYVPWLLANGYSHITDPHGCRGETMSMPQNAQMPASHHPTNWVGDRAVAFIEDADAGQPFYLYTSFIHPHPPWTPPAPWHKLYRPQFMPLPSVPPNFEELWTWVNRDERRATFKDQGVDWQLMRAVRAYYYGCISFVDFQVGRMLETLERRGQLDNTLVLFMADHGDMLGDLLTFHLGSMHEGAAHIPLLARLPGTFEAGRRCDHPASLVDIAPTILNRTGAGTMPGMDGIDLGGLATGQIERNEVFIQFQHTERGIYAVVNDRWKYAYSAGDDKAFLFDRRQDPQETNNVADMPMTNAIQEEMKAVLLRQLNECGETTAADGDDWRRYPDWQPPTSPVVGQRVYHHQWAEHSIPGYTDD